ncbi:MAG: hypothetical protein AAFO75_04240, partial [Pseudomonadota bacterium]
MAKRLTSLKSLSTLGVCVVLSGALAGCSGSSLPSLPKISELNPFKEVQKPLPGRRVPVMETAATSLLPGELAPADTPIVLAPQSANDN